MTPRERILRSIRCQETDRVAVSPFIWVSYANWYFKAAYAQADEALDRKVLEIYQDFGFDPIVRTCGGSSANAQKSGDGWEIRTEERVISADEREVRTSVLTPGGTLSQLKRYQRVSPYEVVEAETEYLLKSLDDVETLMAWQPEVEELDFSRISRCRQMLGSQGVTAPWMQGVFNTCARLTGLENLMIWAYEDPEAYRRLLEYTWRRTAKRGRQMAAAGADILSYEGNMATGTMTGPAFFREFVLQYEQAAIKEIREGGAEILYHNCGDCNAMLEAYNELGISALESLTPPPFGDCDVQRARSVLSPHIAAVGNLDQIAFLPKAAPEEVSAAARKLLDVWKGRKGFILATSDYLMEDTPAENLRAMARAVL